MVGRREGRTEGKMEGSKDCSRRNQRLPSVDKPFPLKGFEKQQYQLPVRP